MKAEEEEFEDTIIRPRAKEIFDSVLQSIWSATDKLFIPVLVIQWLAAMAISIWYSPRSWVGTSSFIHPHVWEATVLGGVMISLPCFLAAQFPSTLRTRLVIATAQAMLSALFIHLTDGRIESHFHVFASLALLAFYRDSKVIVLSSSLVILDHMVRGFWWPESIYGIPVPEPWRFVEHAGWVIIEDTFLLIFCRQTIAEIAEAADRQSRFEYLNTRIETKVVERTESLQLSEERFELALRGTRIGIYDWNLRTDSVYWSTRIYEILGVKPTSPEQSFESAASWLHPEDRDRVLLRVDDAIRQHIPYHDEFRLKSESGTELWVECRGHSILDDDGKPYRFTGGLIDITSRKQVETELGRRDEQLRQSQKMEAIGSLAGGIAHEFNNLLQAIRGYTRYAVKGLAADHRCREDLEQVLLATDRAAALTKQLLGFSRRHSIDRRELHPKNVIRDVVTMLRPLIGEPIEINTRISDDLGTISADPVLMQQMLMNLCINARDAMPSGGQVVLTVKRIDLGDQACKLHSLETPGPYLQISVADNGCGMCPEIQRRIFEPFFTTKEVGVGTGLGLAMVYGIVQKHAGSISVSSKPGVGTTFEILLPINADIAPSPSSLELPVFSQGTETVLVAEDERMVRELIVRILTEAGYKVLSAADGLEAFDIFNAHQTEVSLALIDAVMPQLSGHGLCEKLRARNPALPIVFCTGYNPEAGQLQFMVDQGISLVQKPFVAENLLRLVREKLDSQFLTTEVV